MSVSNLDRRAVLATGAAALAAGGAAAAPQRPNLILFFTDEMRADALGCYGNPVCRTPNFDRLVREGARFANCHTQFTVCGASRCSLLTGWPASVRGHRSLYYFLRPDEPNMFRYLRQAGYDVFWFGKNDALAQASFPDSVTEWRANPPPSPGMMKALGAGPLTPGAMSMLYPPFGDRTETGDYVNVRRAIEVLERQAHERPFCIFLPLSEPHPPYSAPVEFNDLYKPAEVGPLVPPGLPKKPRFHADIRESYGLDKLADADFRRVRAVYYGQVSYSDWLLGELMDALQRTGRDRDTALFVSSDHGDYAGDYGLVEKWPSGLEDCLSHVPLIARIPGGTPGVVEHGMTELYDLMATMLELAGTRAAHTNFARSLVPQLMGQPGRAREAAFTEGGYNLSEPQAFEPVVELALYKPKTLLQHTHPEAVSRCASVRTATHRLVVRPQGQGELYDCAADPGLTHNLIDDRGAANIRADLERRLVDWYVETTGVPPLDKDPRGLPPYPPAG